MKKIALAVLAVLAIGMLFSGCSKNNTPKLQKWQEAEIVEASGKELADKYKRLEVKLVDRQDIEIYYSATGYPIEGTMAWHFYVGCLPVRIEWKPKDKPAEETNRRVYFWISFVEYLSDIPDPIVGMAMPIKKGTVVKIRFSFERDFDGDKKITKEEIEYKNKLIEDIKKGMRKEFRKFEE